MHRARKCLLSRVIIVLLLMGWANEATAGAFARTAQILQENAPAIIKSIEEVIEYIPTLVNMHSLMQQYFAQSKTSQASKANSPTTSRGAYEFTHQGAIGIQSVPSRDHSMDYYLQQVNATHHAQVRALDISPSMVSSVNTSLTIPNAGANYLVVHSSNVSTLGGQQPTFVSLTPSGDPIVTLQLGPARYGPSIERSHIQLQHMMCQVVAENRMINDIRQSDRKNVVVQKAAQENRNTIFNLVDRALQPGVTADAVFSQLDLLAATELRFTRQLDALEKANKCACNILFDSHGNYVPLDGIGRRNSYFQAYLPHSLISQPTSRIRELSEKHADLPAAQDYVRKESHQDPRSKSVFEAVKEAGKSIKNFFGMSPAEILRQEWNQDLFAFKDACQQGNHAKAIEIMQKYNGRYCPLSEGNPIAQRYGPQGHFVVLKGCYETHKDGFEIPFKLTRDPLYPLIAQELEKVRNNPEQFQQLRQQYIEALSLRYEAANHLMKKCGLLFYISDPELVKTSYELISLPVSEHIDFLTAKALSNQENPHLYDVFYESNGLLKYLTYNQECKEYSMPSEIMNPENALVRKAFDDIARNIPEGTEAAAIDQSLDTLTRASVVADPQLKLELVSEAKEIFAVPADSFGQQGPLESDLVMLRDQRSSDNRRSQGKPSQSPGGSGQDPDKDKKERKINTLTKPEYFNRIKDRYKQCRDERYQRRDRAEAIENAEYLAWDNRHKDVEAYDAKGKHLGSIDPQTNRLYKPAVPGRRME